MKLYNILNLYVIYIVVEGSYSLDRIKMITSRFDLNLNQILTDIASY